MLSIRLTRTGKKHAPHYRIVVQEKRSKLNGKAIDQVGHYHPAQPGKLLVLDQEKIKKWLAAGAKPSDTVTNILVKEGVLGKEHKVTYFYSPPAKKEEKPEKVEAKVEKADDAVAEAPVEDEVAGTPAEEAAEAEPADAPSEEIAPTEEAPVEEAVSEAPTAEKTEDSAAEPATEPEPETKES